MAKKKKDAKIPKRFAGVKIPKQVRKGPIGEFVTSPAGQLVIAEVVAAAGGALLKSEADKHPKRTRAVRGKAAAVGALGAGAAREVGDTGARLTHAIGEAARSFARALHGDDEAVSEAPKAKAGRNGGVAAAAP